MLLDENTKHSAKNEPLDSEQSKQIVTSLGVVIVKSYISSQPIYTSELLKLTIKILSSEYVKNSNFVKENIGVNKLNETIDILEKVNPNGSDDSINAGKKISELFGLDITN